MERPTDAQPATDRHHEAEPGHRGLDPVPRRPRTDDRIARGGRHRPAEHSSPLPARPGAAIVTRRHATALLSVVCASGGRGERWARARASVRDVAWAHGDHRCDYFESRFRMNLGSEGPWVPGGGREG